MSNQSNQKSLSQAQTCLSVWENSIVLPLRASYIPRPSLTYITHNPPLTPGLDTQEETERQNGNSPTTTTHKHSPHQHCPSGATGSRTHDSQRPIHRSIRRTIGLTCKSPFTTIFIPSYNNRQNHPHTFNQPQHTNLSLQNSNPPLTTHNQSTHATPDW